MRSQPVAAAHPPGVPAGPGHRVPAPGSAADPLPDLRLPPPAPGSYFFLFFPAFVLLGLIVTSFGQDRGVCIKG